MKLAITNEKEIMSLFDILKEIESIDKYNENALDLNTDEYPILSELDNTNEEYFLYELINRLSSIHFYRILWNLLVLLENCADLTKDTLDFNPDIKKGLELLEKTEG